MKNCLVGQSGGPTAVINGSLYGVIKEGLKNHDQIGTVYGMINGIEGFLAGKVTELNLLSEKNELELLKTTPGAYLGSCRYKLRKTWLIRYIPSFLIDLRKEISAMCFTSAAMIPWIR